MGIAQELEKDVKLCPYVENTDIWNGDLEKDVCIADINEAVDSEKAKCGNEDDII